ncbi:MAG TPA: DUF6790 family protein [Chloroflexota bacterium]|nr:DUF6790 family protein [Chloroflexota bacterium]
MFFVVQWIALLLGAIIHTLVDQRPERRTAPRVVELFLLWLLGGGGLWNILTGLFHISPMSAQIAAGIGYTPSMFQWEVGWADIALGALGFLSLWRRDSFMTAAVTGIAIAFWGFALGHIIAFSHGNQAESNVWAIPHDILYPAVLIWLLSRYRKQASAKGA